MPTLTADATDLTELTDADLDNMLQYLYGKHRALSGDDRLPVHLGIIHILAEQQVRLDAWLALHVAVNQ
jgi:hypothetical protein